MDEHVQWAGWPLIEIRIPDPDEAPAAITSALQAAADRQAPFAAVVHMPETTDPAARREGALERVRMLKKVRLGLRQWCRGLAFVLSAAAQRNSAKAVKSADKLWGCPTTTIDDPEKARAWARQRLSGDP